MEIITESIKSIFKPEQGRISFFNKKDNLPLLLNASYSFSFGTENGGKYGEGLICKEGMVSTILGIDTPYYQIDFPMDGNINLKDT